MRATMCRCDQFGSKAVSVGFFTKKTYVINSAILLVLFDTLIDTYVRGCRAARAQRQKNCEGKASLD
jgi:hypothetical protein